MKYFVFILLFVFSSCAATTKSINTYEEAIPRLHKCWQAKDIDCISKIYGNPTHENEKRVYLNSEGKEVLTVYLDENRNIYSMKLNLLSYTVKSVATIKKLLPSNDWKKFSVPEANPHVVNLAVVHFSKKLGAHFLTYKTDKSQEVKVLYWGGDHKKISI